MRSRENTSRLLAFAWLGLVVLMVCLASNKKSAFDSSLNSLLPVSQQQPLARSAIDQLSDDFSQQLIFVLSGDDDTKVKAAVHLFVKALMDENSPSSKVIQQVDWRTESDQLNQLRIERYPYRFVLLSPAVKQQLQQKTYATLKNQALHKLFSPLPQQEVSVLEDPFGLYAELTNSFQSTLKISIEDSLYKLTQSDDASYMFRVKLSGDSSSPLTQKSILSVIEQQKKSLAVDQIKLSMSGMLLHAAAGAEQAKHEISTIGIGSLLGITLLMLFVFRHVKPLLLMFLTVGVGCTFAATVTVLVFEKVHLITFAFGAGIVGVSIDYALHYLCERYSRTSNDILRQILPGLILALCSSVLAYSAQGLTAFPGLQQMAVFSVSGLIAAWLTVVLFFPQLIKNQASSPLYLEQALATFKAKFPLLNKQLSIKIILFLMLFSSLIIITKSQNLDDIRLLQTSSPELLEEEKQVRDRLGIKSSAKFLLVTGDSIESCLAQEEALQDDLEQLKTNKQIDGYQLISASLPSQETQKENFKLIEQLYEQQLGNFFNKLKLPEESVIKAHEVFSSAQKTLDFESWLSLESSQNIKQQLIRLSQNKVATLIRLEGDISERSSAQLKSIADQYQSVKYVDQVENLSSLFSEYRTRISLWVLLAYISVLVILFMRYKFAVWRVMFAPVVASVLTLACLTIIVGGLNLFHFLALLLVLGIGLDMGIFLYETKESSQTWLAVSMSAFTSLLAFGLLALSKTPVLFHFGLTVLIGLSFVWLLAPLVRNNKFGEILE